MENETIKSALQEISEKFNLYVTELSEKGAFIPRYWPHTQPTFERVNHECVALVRKYMSERQISIGTSDGCISLYNAPLDILPFIPMACPEISDHGTYDVIRGTKRLGRVTYNGMPEQDDPSIIFVGAKTSFVPEEKITRISFQLIYDTEDAK